jgi:hypothetical protein
MIYLSGLDSLLRNWQNYCIHVSTMINNNFQTITDAYQLVSGAKIRGKQQDELFELGDYDANKRGYTLYPFEEGVRFEDFSVVISEKELKNNYLIENIKVNTALAA